MLILGVVVIGIGVPPALAGSPSAYGVITGIDVAPSEPRPDQPFVVTPTIANQAGSPAAIELSSVVLHTPAGSGFRVLDRVTDIGILAPGSSVPVPLSASLKHPGTHKLRVTASGWANGSFVRFRYPVVLTITPRSTPRVTVESIRAIAGERTRINVTVAPQDRTSIHGGLLTVRNSTTGTVQARRNLGTLKGGTAHRIGVPVRFSRAGTHPVTVEFRSRTAQGDERSVEAHTRASVDPANVRLNLSAVRVKKTQHSGLRVRLENAGNVPLTDLTVQTDWGKGRFDSRFIPDLRPREHRVVELSQPTSLNRSAVATVVATYTANNDRHRTETAVPIKTNPGRIVLTGVSVDRNGPQLTVSGHASNIGLTSVRSVVVRPVRTPGIRGIAPQRSYFVGTVPESDFVPFEVTVRASPNVTAIPLRVTGLRDGVSSDRIHTIPVNGKSTEAVPDGDGDPSPLPPVLGAIVTIGVIGMIGVSWRNRDRGD